MGDDLVELPFRAEYAKSGKAACKGCKEKIEKDHLRLAVMVQLPMLDGKVPHWYHYSCFFVKQRPKSVGDISHFESLSWEDQEKIRSKVGSAGNDFYVEYSKSSGATCRKCEEKIIKGDVRASKKDYESDKGRQFGGIDLWHHLDCFVKLRHKLEFWDSGSKLHGFKSLKKEDQIKVEDALPEIKPIKKEEPDVSPVKKPKLEDDGVLKKQNKTMFYFRDQLKNLSKKELISLLEYNDQEIPAGTETMYDRLADVMTFGALLPCTSCKNGQFVFRSGVGYFCLGNKDEWVKSETVCEDPPRKPFKVPDELKEKHEFLSLVAVMANNDLIQLFCSTGLSEQKAKETIKNENLRKRFSAVLTEALKYGAVSECGTLYYHLASKIKPTLENHIPFLVQNIAEKKLNNTQRIDAALQYLLTEMNTNIDVKAFEEFCGVGVVVTADDIEQIIEDVIGKYKDEIIEKRYKFNTGLILQEVRNKLKWADGRIVKNEVDLQILNLIGPKTEEDVILSMKKDKPTAKKETKKPPSSTVPKPVGKVAEIDETSTNDSSLSIIDVMKKLNFHKPGENYTTEGYIMTENTKKLLAEHLKVTGGKVRTRFPPEPNGILHIGHAKAININFGYAEAHGGVCFLRYDDTNPEKEEEKFFVGIREMVEWLGYKPYQITHSSDYFDQLYELAVTLIRKGLAYVCHQKQEDIKGFNPPPSPWRNRPIQDSLILFDEMRKGLIDEGQATLRMKITLEEGKQDPVAYRIKFLPHPRTGDKWCIYPTYDYTHCLCDSLEHITHSLCTKEFQSRRSAYYWLCNSLDMYCPVQWEYGRLNMNYTVVSKRKILKLIETGVVRDWDDPRLYTLTALRRRGFPAEAINRFCARMGVTGAQTVVDPQMLESEVRNVLNESAPRTMVVTEPLKIRITNFKELNLPPTFEVANFPNAPEKGNHTVRFGEVIYIEKSDYKKEADKNYRRLTTAQPVGLRYAGLVISVVKETTERGSVELEVVAKPVNTENKPKAFIHWVSEPKSVEIRVYDRLFCHKNPEDATEVKDGYLSDINPNSLAVLNSLADESLQAAENFQCFQFERIGFFSVDPDSTQSYLVFNRTVTLKEDSGKV